MVFDGEGRNTGLEITADIICHNTSHIIIEIKVYKVFLFMLFHNVKNIVVRYFFSERIRAGIK